MSDRILAGLRPVLPLLLAALVGACAPAPDNSGVAEHDQTPAVSVVTLKVEPRPAPLDFEYVGRVASSREVEVHARVDGVLERRFFEEGSRVRAGQKLYQIDPLSFRARVKEAEAEVAVAAARIKQSEREWARLKPLLETEAVSQKELDDSESTVDLARANLLAAQARLETAKIDLGYTLVKAPLDGVVGRALKVEGSLAFVNGGSLLTSIAQTSPVYVDFGVAETEYQELQRDLASGAVLLESGFVVDLLDHGGRVIAAAGKLEFSDYKSDPATGSFALRATFTNADGRLAPGQFVRVMLRGALRPNALAVPQRSVLDGPAGKFVYLAAPGPEGKPIAEQRPVTVGEWVELDGQLHNGWLIKSGLNAGDLVVIDGMSRIFAPGMTLEPSAAN